MPLALAWQRLGTTTHAVPPSRLQLALLHPQLNSSAGPVSWPLKCPHGQLAPRRLHTTALLPPPLVSKAPLSAIPLTRPPAQLEALASQDGDGLMAPTLPLARRAAFRNSTALLK